MINGVLYTTVGVTRNVVAIDPETGETLWIWRPSDPDERYKVAPRKTSGRGLSYWTDHAGNDRLFVVTPAFYLVAIDPGTGRQVPGFGENGIVDLMVGVRGEVDDTTSIGNSSPPLVIGDVVIVGPAHDVAMRPRSKANLKGDVRGYDARTGRLLWTFHTIPERGEPGYETWFERLRRVHGQCRRLGAHVRGSRSSGSCTCRSRRRSAIAMAASGPGTICSATVSCVSTRAPAR